jgi:hypothetical protein
MTALPHLDPDLWLSHFQIKGFPGALFGLNQLSVVKPKQEGEPMSQVVLATMEPFVCKNDPPDHFDNPDFVLSIEMGVYLIGKKVQVGLLLQRQVGSRDDLVDLVALQAERITQNRDYGFPFFVAEFVVSAGNLNKQCGRRHLHVVRCRLGR